MTKTHEEAADGTRSREGGVFYPKGHALFGFADADTADRGQAALRAMATSDGDCVRIDAASLIADAERELDRPGLLAGFGSSVGVREQQLKLAREGAEFVLAKAEDEAAGNRLLDALQDVPLIYGARYGTLVIENLVSKAANTEADARPARLS